MAEGRLFHSPRRTPSPLANIPSAEDVNWIGNLHIGPDPTFFPVGRRPPRPYVNLWAQRFSSWNEGWAERHVSRVRELDAIFNAFRLINGEGTCRIWADFMVDVLYLNRRIAVQAAWAEYRGLDLTDSESD